MLVAHQFLHQLAKLLVLRIEVSERKTSVCFQFENLLLLLCVLIRIRPFLFVCCMRLHEIGLSIVADLLAVMAYLELV